MRLNALPINIWYKKQYSELKFSSKTKGLKMTDGYLENVHPAAFYSTAVQYYFFTRND